MSARGIRCALLALAALASGCIHPRAMGHFGEGAFYMSRGHYRVRYMNAEARRLLPSGWTLESYRFDDDGRPIDGRRDARFTSAYDARTFSPGGRPRVFAAPRFDLWFRHEDGKGAIWARTMPLTPAWSQLRPIQLAHAGVYGRDGRWGPSPDLLGLEPVAHRITAVHRERPARVDGQPAYAMTFDVAVRTVEGAHTSRTTIVVVAPPRALFVERRARVRARAAVVFGCTSAAEHHDQALADLERLVRRVDFAP